MVVEELWRYPVKSMQGELLEAIELTPAGPAGDRLFAIRDLSSGRILTGRRNPELLIAEARLDGAVVRITLPDGSATGSDDTEVDRVLSAWLGRPVRLERWAGRSAEFEVPAAAELVAWTGRAAGSRVVATTPSTAFTDAGQLHLVLGDRLRAMRARFGAGAAARRFRPNLVLSTDPAAPPEAEWENRRVRIGTALLEVTGQAMRCVMLARPVRGLPDAEGILRTLAAESRARFGLYAEVVEPGRLLTGATLELLPGQG